MILLLGQDTMTRARISEKPELPKSVPRPVELQVIGNTSLKYFHKYVNMQVKKSGSLVSTSAPHSFLLKIPWAEAARLQQPVGTPELGPG